MKQLYLICCTLLLSINMVLAQPVIKLNTGNFTSTNPAKNPANDVDFFKGNFYQGRYYVWLQFNELPTEAAKQSLLQTGISFHGYLPEKAFIASFPQGYSYENLKQYKVFAVTKLLPESKIDPAVFSAAQTIPWAAENDSIRSVYVSFIPVVSRDVMAGVLLEAGFQFSRLPNADGEELVIKASIDELKKMATHPLVHYMENIARPPVVEDFQATSNHRSTSVNTSDNWATGRKLDGSGVVISIGDDGFIGPHLDFTGRIGVNATNTATANTHADHCAGIILGSGNYNPIYRGNAPAAALRAYDNYGDFSVIATNYNTNNVRITSHSLGQTCNEGYSSSARTSDLHTRTYPSLMHVHSAGNSGTDVCGGLSGGWRTITGGYKAGKNILAVANLTKSDVISSSSSKGPLPDGRLKPDIAAVGNAVLSTQPNNAYASMSGTSMACPAVAGSLALLYQAYRKQNSNQDPNSGLIKAILMNTADDLGNAGPDFTYGFGRVNIRKAVECIENTRYFSGSISQGVTNNHNIQVPANVYKAKVMVYWVDKEATAGANPSLVNNIDSWIVTPETWTETPWILNAGPTPTAASCAAPATRGGVDTLNNVEQIEMDVPVQGTYQLKVAGAKIPSGPQEYFVVVEYQYNDQVVVTYPYGGESFVPGESQRIRWDAAGNTGNFSVQYSTNGGSSWSTITTSVASNLRYYDWTVPSIVTGQARIRITRGSVSDISDTNFVIINVPTISSITAVCNNVSKVTWTAVTGATGYDVFKLGSKFMELVGSTTSTNLNVTSPANQDEWFAVRAKLGERMYGRRSIATLHNNFFVGTCNMPLQLVAFNASKKGNQVELIWQTAQEQNIIKYVIERSTSPTFDDMVIIGEMPAKNSAQQQYSLLDKNILAKGAYYYRLKIVERDKVVYSAIKSIKWDGFAGSVVLYPNPASNNVFVQSQDDYGMVDAQLVNSTGAVVQSWKWTLNNGTSVTADISKVPSGTYFLVLRSAKDGELVVRQQLSIIK